jgi:hypothetical protein
MVLEFEVVEIVFNFFFNSTKCFGCSRRVFLQGRATQEYECKNCELLNIYYWKSLISLPQTHHCGNPNYCQTCVTNNKNLIKFKIQRPSKEPENLFCSQCLHNQNIQLSLLNQVPEEYDIAEYKKTIEKRHPICCALCKPKIKLKLAKKESWLKQHLFYERLKNSQKLLLSDHKINTGLNILDKINFMNDNIIFITIGLHLILFLFPSIDFNHIMYIHTTTLLLLLPCTFTPNLEHFISSALTIVQQIISFKILAEFNTNQSQILNILSILLCFWVF